MWLRSVPSHMNAPCISLCAQDKDSMVALTNAVDKANGYCYGSVEGADQSVFEISASINDGHLDPVLDIQEKYMQKEP